MVHVYQRLIRIGTEAVTQSCSIKKVFLKISRNSQEITCPTASLLKKIFWHRRFSVNSAEFLRTPF